MGRRRPYRDRPAHFIPAQEFRHVNEWCNREVMDHVECSGGIEAHDLVQILLSGRGGPPVGWSKLSTDRQSKAVWRAINRLEDKRLIERYYSKHRDHNRSRVRLRPVSVLDRIVHAVEQAEKAEQEA